MKGSAITGPVGKEAAELWPVSAPALLHSAATKKLTRRLAYCLQLRCRDVKTRNGKRVHGRSKGNGFKVLLIVITNETNSILLCHESIRNAIGPVLNEGVTPRTFPHSQPR